MATKNPKISVYVPDLVKQKLEEERLKRKSHSLSAVAVEILEEYFGLVEPTMMPKSDAWVEQNDAHFREVDARLNAIEAVVFSTNPQTERKEKRSVDTKPKAVEKVVDQLKLSETQGNAEETQTLTTPEVTELTGLSRKQLEGARKRNNLPIQGNGWEVVGFAGKQRVDGVLKNHWTLRKIKT